MAPALASSTLPLVTLGLSPVEEKQFHAPNHWRREAIRSLTKELVREKVDPAIHPGENRKEVALDVCFTGS